MSWTDSLDLTAKTALALRALPRHVVAQGTVLFRPGEAAQVFVVMLRGRIEVRLTSHQGREILLYAVAPGESCVQSTLGLLGDEDYSGEAVAVTEAEVVLIPKALFLHLMEGDAGFRRFVLRAFGQRMTDLTRVLMQVAFGRIDGRLAAALLDLAAGDRVNATQAELAARIGSAREVVTRALQGFAAAGMIRTLRGHVVILDAARLRQLAAGLV